MLLPFFAAASQLLNLDIYESNSIGNSEICQPEQFQGRKHNVVAIIVGENKRYGSIKAKWQIVGCFQTKLWQKNNLWRLARLQSDFQRKSSRLRCRLSEVYTIKIICRNNMVLSPHQFWREKQSKSRKPKTHRTSKASPKVVLKLNSWSTNSNYGISTG